MNLNRFLSFLREIFLNDTIVFYYAMIFMTLNVILWGDIIYDYLNGHDVLSYIFPDDLNNANLKQDNKESLVEEVSERLKRTPREEVLFKDKQTREMYIYAFFAVSIAVVAV